MVKAIEGAVDTDITDVDIDSRKVAKGHLFVAIKGTQTDGHQYIPKAIELGASRRCRRNVIQRYAMCRWNQQRRL